MRPKDSDEIRAIVNQDIRVFNNVVSDEIPNIYKISDSPTPDSLMRLKDDFDAVAREYNFKSNNRTKQLYLRIRERLEALRDMEKNKL